MTCAILFLRIALAFWCLLWLVDRVWPRRKPQDKWSSIVNASIRKYIKEQETNILRNRKLMGMLRRKRGATTIRFTGSAKPPPEVQAKYEAMAKDIMRDMKDMAVDPEFWEQPEHRGTRPPSSWPGFVYDIGSRTQLFDMDGRLYRVVDYDVAYRTLKAIRLDDGALLTIPKVEFMARVERNTAKLWGRLGGHRHAEKTPPPLQGTFKAECYGPDGKLKWQEIRPNKIVTDGLNTTITYDPTKQPPPRIIYPEPEDHDGDSVV